MITSLGLLKINGRFLNFKTMDQLRDMHANRNTHIKQIKFLIVVKFVLSYTKDDNSCLWIIFGSCQ